MLRDAERHSQLIAEDINHWLVTEGSEIQPFEQNNLPIFYSRPRRSPGKHKSDKQAFKNKKKRRNFKQINSNAHNEKKKHHHSIKISIRNLHSSIKSKLKTTLRVEKHEPANSDAWKKSKAHSKIMHNRVKMASKVSSSKQAGNVKKDFKNRTKKKKSSSKKSTVPKKMQTKQNTHFSHRKPITNIKPKVLEVFQKLPKETLTTFLQKKGVSSKIIEVIMKKVKSPNGSTHKSKNEASNNAKRDEIMKPILSSVIKKKTGLHKDQVRKQNKSYLNNKDKLSKKLKTRDGRRKVKQKDLTSTHSGKVIHSFKTSSKVSNSSTHEHSLNNSPIKKLDSLRHKIRTANDLKLRVAKALLSHCETQNKLKKVFENVNKSLKKASKLAKAIGEKFGISKQDIDHLTSDHTRDVVEEFLGKIF